MNKKSLNKANQINRQIEELDEECEKLLTLNNYSEKFELSFRESYESRIETKIEIRNTDIVNELVDNMLNFKRSEINRLREEFEEL